MAQKGCFWPFSGYFWDSDLPKSDNKFYQKNIFAKKLAQAKTFDQTFGHLGIFSISFTT